MAKCIHPNTAVKLKSKASCLAWTPPIWSRCPRTYSLTSVNN